MATRLLAPVFAVWVMCQSVTLAGIPPAPVMSPDTIGETTCPRPDQSGNGPEPPVYTAETLALDPRLAGLMKKGEPILNLEEVIRGMRSKRSMMDTIEGMPDETVNGRNRSAAVSSQVNAINVADDVDLCFLVDITGSMSPFIQAVKDSINDIVNDLQNSTDGQAVTDMRIAFVGYRDHMDDKQFEVLDFTPDVVKFRDFVSKTEATGGADTPEDVHGGLDRTLSLEWGDQSRTRLIFHMADAPAHGCEMHLLGQDTFKNGDPENRTFSELFGRLREMDIQFFFGNITDQTDTMVQRMSDAYGQDINTIDLGITSRAPGGGFGYAPAALSDELYGAVYESVKAAVAKKKTDAGSVKMR